MTKAKLIATCIPYFWLIILLSIQILERFIFASFSFNSIFFSRALNLSIFLISSFLTWSIAEASAFFFSLLCTAPVSERETLLRPQGQGYSKVCWPSGWCVTIDLLGTQVVGVTLCLVGVDSTWVQVGKTIETGHIVAAVLLGQLIWFAVIFLPFCRLSFYLVSCFLQRF